MPKKVATAQTTVVVKKFYRIMTVTEDLNLAPIDVDFLQPDDSITIGADDAILWFSGSGSKFKIPTMKKDDGPGPDKPFSHHFSSADPFRDHLSSGLALRAGNTGDKSKYKYTVLFDDHAKIDPTVIIQQ